MVRALTLCCEAVLHAILEVRGVVLVALLLDASSEDILRRWAARVPQRILGGLARACRRARCGAAPLDSLRGESNDASMAVLLSLIEAGLGSLAMLLQKRGLLLTPCAHLNARRHARPLSDGFQGQTRDLAAVATQLALRELLDDLPLSVREVFVV